MITEVEGSIFEDIKPYTVIVHQCNAKGWMGAGIAKEIRRRWPKVFDEYHKYCSWFRDVAEEKGYYKLDVSLSPELDELTKEIREKYIEPNGHIMQELGKSLIKAHALCEQANIRYEDYLDRVLQLPRTTAKSASKVGMLPPEDASVGFDNMKILASCKKAEDKASAKEAMNSGKSPDSVIAMMKKKTMEIDPREKLEKEKARLTRTISELTQRLEFVEDTLANM